MALPDAPQTRSEQYLNAIATGSTSGIPEAPQTRMEQYLDAIANNGGGSSGGGDFLVVNFQEQDGVATADKTYTEITSAFQSGALVVGKLNEVYFSQSSWYDGDTVAFTFLYLNVDRVVSLFYISCSIQADNSVTANSTRMTGLSIAG